jgi:hypothetical protein
MRLFNDTEGYANAILGDSADTLLESCREAEANTRRVLEVVKYIARYGHLPENKRSIQAAKRFISEWAEFKFGDDKLPGEKSLEKTWAEYRAAAPILFAIYNDPKFSFSMFNSIEGTVHWIKEFCSDDERFSLFRGRAASIAKLLKQHGVQDVRINWFDGVSSLDFDVAPFTQEQLTFIEGLDLGALPNDRGEPFRAKRKRAH